MARITILLMALLFGLAACAVPDSGGRLGPDGKPLPNAYKIRKSQTAKIQFRMLDSVNALRGASGVGAVQMNPQLNAAAQAHSLDMSVQGRPWNFGSDGSSPIDRVQRAGYSGGVVGENISESFESELETLAAWMEDPGTRAVILEPRAVNMGFAWYQEPSGKIWWTLLMGS